MSRRSLLFGALALAVLMVAGAAVWWSTHAQAPSPAVAPSGPSAIPSGRTIALATEAPLPDSQPAPKTANAASPNPFGSGQRYLLDERAIALLPKAVEGEIVADVVEFDGPTRALTLRVRQFEMQMPITLMDPPALLFMPPGSLVRATLSDVLSKTVASDATLRPQLAKGRTTRMVARVGRMPGTPGVQIVSIGPKKGESGK